MDLTRQLDIVDTERLNLDLAIVGAGAIGSLTTLNICKMGYAGNITVYDNDRVEGHNLPNQFYGTEDLGELKIAAIRRICFQMAQKQITTSSIRIDQVPLHHEVCILAVDDMDTRINLYNGMKDKLRWLIDGRMGGEIMRIYTIDLRSQDDKRLYENNLYPTAEAAPLRCTAQAVIYNVSVIAGLITNQLKKALLGQPYTREIVFDLGTLTLLTS